MSASDRRDFLKRIALASAGAAAATSLPIAALGERTDASIQTHPTLPADAQSWGKAPCNLCGVGCGLLVAVENGRAVAVRGDPESPVGRGLACVKGYHSIQALYGRDRLTRALVRRNGRLTPAPVPEALDLVARALADSMREHGRDSVALYGSGDWTIPAGYAATKLFRGGLGTNNVEASTRLESASAAAGLATSFGLDQPVGCYEDIDHADVFVLWDTNVAEEHPVLFSRMLERRQKNRSVRIIDIASRTTRTSYAADRSLIVRPQTEAAVANGICHELVVRGWIHRDFIGRHVAIKRGRTGIGYGRPRDGDFTEDVADAGWTDYVSFLADYSPEAAARISGLGAADIRWLASLYADRSRRVMSLWGAGVNARARGTWLNNLLYNIHLVVGKIATPGNSPLALATEASGSGTGREAGMLAEALPGGRVGSREDRERAARIWGVPADRIAPRPGHRALPMFRALDRGDIRFLWVQGSNPMAVLPELRRFRDGARREGRFIVVSAAYPTATTDVADVVLPTSLWIEQEGLFGNSERRTQHFEQMLRPPGESMSEAWQVVEVARRLGFGELFGWDRPRHVEQIWNEYSRFRDATASALPPLSELRARPGVIWPYVDGRETKWRYNPDHDPAADRARGSFDFYGNPDHRAWLWLRPYEPPAETPDDEYPLWLRTGPILEHSASGTLTRRIPTLHRAAPHAYAEVNRDDAAALGIRQGDRVRLVSRRASLELEARIDHRSQPPRGQIFVPSFDESVPVSELLLDAHCPISGQADRTCAVRLETLGGRRR